MPPAVRSSSHAAEPRHLTAKPFEVIFTLFNHPEHLRCSRCSPTMQNLGHESAIGSLKVRGHPDREAGDLRSVSTSKESQKKINGTPTRMNQPIRKGKKDFERLPNIVGQQLLRPARC